MKIIGTYTKNIILDFSPQLAQVFRRITCDIHENQSATGSIRQPIFLAL